MQIPSILDADLVPSFRARLSAAGVEPLAGRVNDSDFPYLVNQALEASGFPEARHTPWECKLPYMVASYLQARTGQPAFSRLEADLPELLRQAIIADTGEDPGSRTEADLPGLWCLWVENLYGWTTGTPMPEGWIAWDNNTFIEYDTDEPLTYTP